MARFTASPDFAISLFPIFNILVCVLGCLLLIGGTIVSFSLGVQGIVITNATVEEIRDASSKAPVYIEWDGNSIFVHPQKYKVALDIKGYNLGHSDLNKVMTYLDLQAQRSGLGDVINCLAHKRNERHLVILVRPSGFKNFLYLREFIISKGIDIGYEAVGQHWVLSSANVLDGSLTLCSP